MKRDDAASYTEEEIVFKVFSSADLGSDTLFVIRHSVGPVYIRKKLITPFWI